MSVFDLECKGLIRNTRPRNVDPVLEWAGTKPAVGGGLRGAVSPQRTLKANTIAVIRLGYGACSWVCLQWASSCHILGSHRPQFSFDCQQRVLARLGEVLSSQAVDGTGCTLNIIYISDIPERCL